MKDTSSRGGNVFAKHNKLESMDNAIDPKGFDALRFEFTR